MNVSQGNRNVVCRHVDRPLVRPRELSTFTRSPYLLNSRSYLKAVFDRLDVTHGRSRLYVEKQEL